ncbi:MAG: class I SAM-dependent methyltransferase [Gammaproteobacteria bacterium]|nr:class I SAM-dependent methyltransferase [Gammaproteobacteria bacterium]
MVDASEFYIIYDEVCEECTQRWSPEMQREVAQHCHGWSPELFDFTSYFRSSSVRFYAAYQKLKEQFPSNATVCDVGGFGGVFPIVLSRLGYEVFMTESLEYYSAAFDPLFSYVENHGVTVIDYDPFGADKVPKLKIDFLTCMAVLEHYPHSPSLFMENIKQLLKVSGVALFEVPNIAYWENRKKLLFGVSPLVPIEHIFRSKTPFIGHHHEYAKDELLTLMRLSDFHVLDVDTYNYSRVLPNGFLEMIKHIKASSMSEVIFDITTALFPNTRECISVVVKSNF